MNLTITLAQILAFRPCAPRTEAAIRQFGRRPDPDEAIPLVALVDAGLSIDDLCRILARTHRPLLIGWATDCAEHKIEYAESLLGDFEACRPGDLRPRNAIIAARLCIAGVRDGVGIDEMRRRRDAAAYAADAADARKQSQQAKIGRAHV